MCDEARLCALLLLAAIRRRPAARSRRSTSRSATSRPRARTRASRTTCSSPTARSSRSTSSDFNGPTVGGEWLVPIGNFLEAGAGRQLLAPHGAERLPGLRRQRRHRDRRRTSGCASCRWRSPCGCCRSARRSPVQPYVGAGLGVINWRYSESGEFIDFADGRDRVPRHVRRRRQPDRCASCSAASVSPRTRQRRRRSALSSAPTPICGRLRRPTASTSAAGRIRRRWASDFRLMQNADTMRHDDRRSGVSVAFLHFAS